jgi:hypothetical protein
MLNGMRYLTRCFIIYHRLDRYGYLDNSLKKEEDGVG